MAHLEHQVEDHHLEKAKHIEEALHLEDYFHSHPAALGKELLNKIEISKDCSDTQPLPAPKPEPVTKVEIKKASCDDSDKISVEFKKEPIPEDAERELNKQQINFDNKPKYKENLEPNRVSEPTQ